MRLIDADALIEETRRRFPSASTLVRIKRMITDAPTAYDVDAVIAELEERRACFDCKKCKYFERGIGTCDKDCADALIDDLIDIVRNEGKDGGK